ncbi:MAG: hypothetical protein R8K54_00720 [Mariprofundaceae bacterium]
MKGNRNRWSVAFTLVFAVQILAAGFCLLTPQIHAATAAEMPMSADIAVHCTNGDNTNAEYEAGHADQNTACAHCDLPNKLVQNKVSTFNIGIDLPAVTPVHMEIKLSAPVSIDLAARPLTGPPRSSSLLYTITQRIRV